MPSITDVIDTVLTPPLAALQQVLDTNGPFAGGDHVFDHFHTDGAFLLPAGDHQVNGTYGVVTVVSTFPAQAGRAIRFNGLVGGQDKSEDEYLDLIGQITVWHSLPITGAIVPTSRLDITHPLELFLWSPYLGSGQYVTLHVFPNFAVEMYYLCVL